MTPAVPRRTALKGGAVALGTVLAGGSALYLASEPGSAVAMGELVVSGDDRRIQGDPEAITLSVSTEYRIQGGDPDTLEQLRISLFVDYDGESVELDDYFEIGPEPNQADTVTLEGDVLSLPTVAPSDFNEGPETVVEKDFTARMESSIVVDGEIIDGDASSAEFSVRVEQLPEHETVEVAGEGEVTIVPAS